MPGGRPHEYDLSKYSGINVIYGLYTESEGIRYIGKSKNVKTRINHHLNNEYETNLRKRNWVEKNKNRIKVKILSIDPSNWEKEEQKYIKKYDNLLNICSGGSNNIHTKAFELKIDEEHLLEINKSLSQLNKIFPKRFSLITNQEIKNICNLNK